ncbi:histone deacetylase [Mucor velutinosus]|uniref:Histone deacetylase n=1 Tax=Mucor velutinosus TaxID=708070 RepID=A0AAN7HQS3_9FUNG|nr:histone deacetylase [Mucor velutinosus]
MSNPHNINVNSSKEEEMHTVFDTLIPSLEALSDGFKDMHKQFDKLKKVNDNLVEFNDSFGAFLFGLAANDTTIKWRSPITESEIAKHKKHLNQLQTHEATKAVQIVKQPPHTATAASSSSTAVATASSSSAAKAKSAPRPLLKRPITEKSPENARKKQKTIPEIPKQLVSNRRFEPKVNVTSIINRLPIKYQDRGAPHDHMTSVLKILGLHPEGLTARKLSSETRLAQRFITDCVNTLVFRKEVIKVQEEGQYARYLFDPARFPSVPK